MTTATLTTGFYSKLNLTQNGNTFVSQHDLSVATPQQPTDEETIAYLLDGLDGCLEDELDEGNTIDLNGKTELEFATLLVKEEKYCRNELGIEWNINTKWESADQSNWENHL